MDQLVLPLADPKTPLVTIRCLGYARFLDRLASADGRISAVLDGGVDAGSALPRLAAAAGLTPAGESPVSGEIRYVPTLAARERVGADQDGAWPSSLVSRHRKAIRRTRGVLLTFPLEDAAEADPPLEVFTTDWSPSPAACAVAVHPGHPLSRGLGDGRTAAFTGRYCRHPLTGDLLPIWTAGWVKPEFGTGAVLVNPAHDPVDLAFGREIGLPVRFALHPSGRDDSPENWPVPPVVKTGTAVRTGPTDGLDFMSAQAEYFRILSTRGLAREYTDYGTGSFTVATFTADGPGKVVWDEDRRTAATAEHPSAGGWVPVSAAAVLAVLDLPTHPSRLAVVGPSSVAESDLLALRLLLAEPGLGPLAESAPDVLLVGTATGRTDGVEQDVLELAVLTAAAPQEVAALKPPHLETTQRFLAAHAALAGVGAGPGGDDDPATVKVGGQVKALLRDNDTKQAFTHLYRLQKTLAKSEAPPSSHVVVYETLAWVVTGAPSRFPTERLRAVWASL
ncbi:MAG TPA: hypothetical protein VI248_13905 [Kineosporiaceae bacterium]